MRASDWRTHIGDSAFEHIVGSANNDEEAVARLLSRAVEAGFVAPMAKPVISPDGAKVLWPREGGDGVEPVLTAAGLEKHWRIRGHGWLILRAQQLARAVAGPMLPRLQAIMNAYEEQCQADGVEMLPADVRWFVGGRGESSGQHLASVFAHTSPKPGKIERKVFQPGDQA